MSLFFRLFQHLLPRAEAWKIRQTSEEWEIGDEHEIGEPDLFIGGRFGGSTLSRFFEGLTAAPEDARGFVDVVFGDCFPSTTRGLEEFEKQFGLEPNPDETVRRQALAAAWAAGGGQSPAYLQGILQTAGFNVFVHEWWSSGPPYVTRNPRLYTSDPLFGLYQCTGAAFVSAQPECTPTGMAGQPQCNRFLANEPRYLVNKNLTNDAPPPILDDPSVWPFFIYIGAASFPSDALVPAARRAEFERLLLKLRPTQQWIVTLVTYYS